MPAFPGWAWNDAAAYPAPKIYVHKERLLLCDKMPLHHVSLSEAWRCVLCAQLWVFSGWGSLTLRATATNINKQMKCCDACEKRKKNLITLGFKAQLRVLCKARTPKSFTPLFQTCAAAPSSSSHHLLFPFIALSCCSNFEHCYCEHNGLRCTKTDLKTH